MAIHFDFHHGRYAFLTMTSHKRLNILLDKSEVIIKGWEEVTARHGVGVLAYSILPNHLHCLLDTQRLPINAIIHAFKLASGKLYHASHVARRTPLWDPSAFVQMLKSKKDIERHIDFIHFNAVRHGLVLSPWDWERGSFRNFVHHGYYLKDWTLDKERLVKLKELDDTDVPTLHKTR